MGFRQVDRPEDEIRQRREIRQLSRARIGIENEKHQAAKPKGHISHNQNLRRRLVRGRPSQK